MEDSEMSTETRAFLSIIIHEIDQYLRDPKLSDKEKITEIEALLYTWIMANDLDTSRIESIDLFDESDLKKRIGKTIKLESDPE